MEATGISISSNDKTAEETVLSLKCSLHKQEFCDFIDLSLSTQNTRICFSCIQELNIPTNKVLSIRQLLSSSADSYLKSFPVLEDTQLISSVQSIVGTVETITNQYEKYFVNLKSAIEASIEKAKHSQKLKLTQLTEQYKKTKDCFQDAARIEELKAFFLANANQSSNAFKQYIQTHVQRSQASSLLIKAELKEFQRFSDEFSLKQPEETLELASDLIGQLDLFLGLTETSMKLSAIMVPLSSQPSLTGMNPDLNHQNSAESFIIDELRKKIKVLIIESVLKKNSENELNEQLKYSQKIKIRQFEDGRYEGELRDNKVRHGKGQFIYSNGNKYEGEWKNDECSGQGKLFCQNGQIYEGEFKDNKKSGQGKFFWPDGTRYEGELKDNMRDGQGKHFYLNGNIFEGRYKKDNRNGPGKLYGSSGRIIEQGYYQNGKLL